LNLLAPGFSRALFFLIFLAMVKTIFLRYNKTIIDLSSIMEVFDFQNKKITVMGLAAEGRGLQDAEFCLARGAQVTVTDLKPAEQLAVAVERLKKYDQVTYVLGEHRISDFTDADLVIRSASAPLDSPYLAAAREARVAIHTDESLFFTLAGQQGIELKTIGVTGTRGKSTVTQLIFEILKSKFSNVHLGGNLRGLALLPLLDEVSNGDYLVMELDSWKLQGLGEHQWSPYIAVFTTFMDDHMNYYRNDADRYLADKAQIFLYQKPSDYLVVGTQPFAVIKDKYGEQIKSQLIGAPADIDPTWSLKIVGTHNRYNAALAIEVAKLFEISEEQIKSTVENFAGLPGRLEYLGEYGGVKYYNDNNATTPDATSAALKSFADRRLILICGGGDKQLDVQLLIDEIRNRVTAVVLLAGTGTERIKDQLLHQPNIVASEHQTLAECVAQARAIAQAGDIVLFSPAFTSFGSFANEYERNDEFVALVANQK